MGQVNFAKGGDPFNVPTSLDVNSDDSFTSNALVSYSTSTNLITCDDNGYIEIKASVELEADSGASEGIAYIRGRLNGGNIHTYTQDHYSPGNGERVTVNVTVSSQCASGDDFDFVVDMSGSYSINRGYANWIFYKS